MAFTDDLQVQWAQGYDMHTGAEVLVPASLVYVTYPRSDGPTRNEPLTNPVISAGIAAGDSRAAAECAALEELIERDAVTVAWLSGAPLERIATPATLAPVLRGPLGVLDTTLFFFRNPYQLPVLGALMHNRQTGIVTLGTACRAHPFEAALKAMAEAAQLQMVAWTLDEPQSTLVQMATGAGGALKPWRADRCYRQSYRSDWRDVVDLLCQLQVYLDPSMRPLLSARLANSVPIKWRDLPTASSRSRDSYLERITHVGVRLVSVDVTTPDLQ